MDSELYRMKIAKDVSGAKPGLMEIFEDETNSDDLDLFVKLPNPAFFIPSLLSMQLLDSQ